MHRLISFLLALTVLCVYSGGLPVEGKEKCKCWIDVKTGKPVGTMPVGALYAVGVEGEGEKAHSGGLASGLSVDGKTAFNPTTGKNYAKEGKCWVDVKTGKTVGKLSGLVELFF